MKPAVVREHLSFMNDPSFARSMNTGHNTWLPKGHDEGASVNEGSNRRAAGQVKATLVTGPPRSGSTWVGRMLAASPSFYYVHEPFNPQVKSRKRGYDVSFKHHYTYICEENESLYLEGIRRVVQGRFSWRPALASLESISDVVSMLKEARLRRKFRKQNVFPLIKDPIALVSAEWMATRFDINVIAMIRHPAAFVASMKRLGWPFRAHNWALSQPCLLHDVLEPFRSELEDLDRSQRDVVDQASLLWKVLTYITFKYQERHANWIFLRHEDISSDPVKGFQALYQKLGLNFTPDIQETVFNHSHATNPSAAQGKDMLLKLNSQENIKAWKWRLSSSEIERIRHNVEPISRRYYSDSEW